MKKNKNFDLKLFIFILFVYFYPALLTFLFPFILDRLHFETDIVENFVFAFLILVVTVYFLNKKIKLALLLLFFLYLFALVETTYLLLFRSYFTSSSIFIFFESNSSEIVSFSKQYGSIGFYFIASSLALIYLLFTYLLFKRKIYFPINGIKIKKTTVAIFTLTGFLLLLFSPLKRSFFPMVVANAVIDYNKQMKAYNSMKYKDKSDFFEDVVVKNDSVPETYIIVIGESTSRKHMGLYGYSRQTTPLLQSISDDLFIFDNVTTPNTHTLTSLEKVLTLGTTENIDLKYKGNFIQLFNQAGFETYWLSNQKPTGIWDNFITGISNSAHKKVFFNISGDKSPYDEVVLSSMNNIIKDNKKKQLIVLHLMGTHLTYEDRYPNSFEKFRDKPKTKFQSDFAFKTINAYDNAILYQDFILYSVINKIKQKRGKNAVLFISDHGEEVFDSIDFFGHTESKGTKTMYDIPFILWMSKDKIKEENELVFDVKRKYSTENLIFTIADLASLKFKNFEASKSIFNHQFLVQKRFIFDNKTYDSYFKDEQ